MLTYILLKHPNHVEMITKSTFIEAIKSFDLYNLRRWKDFYLLCVIYGRQFAWLDRLKNWTILWSPIFAMSTWNMMSTDTSYFNMNMCSIRNSFQWIFSKASTKFYSYKDNCPWTNIEVILVFFAECNEDNNLIFLCILKYESSFPEYQMP